MTPLFVQILKTTRHLILGGGGGLCTASVNIYWTKKCISIVMKPCFSEGKLMKHFGNPTPPFLKESLFQLTHL